MKNLFFVCIFFALFSCDKITLNPGGGMPPIGQGPDSALICNKLNLKLSQFLSGRNSTRSWVVTRYAIVNPDGTETLAAGLNESCILDNELQFRSGGEFYEPQNTRCTPQDPDPADIGTWSVKNCGKVIYLDTITFPDTEFSVTHITHNAIVVEAEVYVYGPASPVTLRAYLQINTF